MNFKPGDVVIFGPESSYSGTLGVLVKQETFATYDNKTIWTVKPENRGETYFYQDDFRLATKLDKVLK